MIRVRTLGQCLIQIDSVSIGPDAEMVFAAMLLLAVEPGKRLGRGDLLGMLWPNAQGSRAAHCLRQTIYRLRTLGVPIETQRGQLSLPPAAVDCDVDALLRVRRANDVEQVAEAIGGPFLPGYSPTFSEPLRDWVERHRDLVTAGARRVLVGAIVARKARGEWADVERLAHQCLAIDPLNEDATLALAEGAALHGGKAEAMGILDRYLREMGPTARELRLPAIALRRRIAEPELEFPLAPPLQVPFVGRSAEMATLSAALRSARAGAGSVHFIYGEPGIGKTRLLTEFSRAASLDGARIASALCQSSDTRRPLSAFVDLVPKLMTMPGALGCSPQSHKYLRRLIEHQSSDSPPSPDTAEASLLQANIRRSLFDLLDAISSESVLLVAVDDTHWLDPASWEIVSEATRWLETRRMLLLLTSREPEPRYPPGLVNPPLSLRLLELGPIDHDARKALFEATLGGARHSKETFRSWCLEMSGGNPYYLSELALHGSEGNGEFEIPPSLTTLVGQRVSRLQQSSRRVLQACAILGKNATLARVQAILDQPCIELLNSFDELESAGLIETSGDRIVTRHDLLAQAATSGASHISQKLLHRKAASVLQDDFLRTELPSLAWDGAEHWRVSGEAEKGVELGLTCARYSLQYGRPTEAAEILRHVLPWSLDVETRLRVWAEYAHALRAAEQWNDLAATLEELLPHIDPCKKPDLASGFRLELLEARWNAGKISATVVDDLIEECSTGRASSFHKLRAATAAITISENLCCAKTAARVEHFARALANLHVDEFVGRDYDLVYQCSYGDLDRAMDVAATLVDHIRKSESKPLLCRYLLRAAHVFEVGDRLDDSLNLAREAFSIAESFALCASACLAARRLGWAYLDRLSTEQVAEWTQRGEAWGSRTQHPASIADLSMLRAEVALASGCVGDAATLFERSQTLWGPLKHPRAEAHALALKIALSVERCEAITDRDANEAWRLFHILAGKATLDLAVGRFVLGLAASGRNAESVEMLDSYLSRFRRERGPVRPVLRHILARAQEQFGLVVQDSSALRVS